MQEFGKVKVRFLFSSKNLNLNGIRACAILISQGGDHMKMEKIVFSTFIVLGLILFVVGTLVCANVFVYNNKAETNAIITDFESYQEYSGGEKCTHHKTHLTYKVDGQSYSEVADMYSSSWEIGEEIEIYYDINDPKNIGSKHTDIALLVIPCLGFFDY